MTIERLAALGNTALALMVVGIITTSGQPVTASPIMGMVLITGAALASLVRAYHGPAISKWWRTKRYDRTVDGYLHR